MNRKQEIKEQIGKLQQELIALEGDEFEIVFKGRSGWPQTAKVPSLKDSDIIDAIESNQFISSLGNQNVIVTCNKAAYEQRFYVTEVKSYSVTPF